MVKHFIHETRKYFQKEAGLNTIEQIEHLEHPEQIERS